LMELEAHLTDLTARAERGDGIAFELDVRRASDALGWKPKVLERELRHDNLHLVLEEKDGKTSVSVKDDKGDVKPLSEYASSHWSEYLPALTGASGGAKVPRQESTKGSGGEGGESVARAFIEKQRRAGHLKKGVKNGS
jgi:hypothetical protein